VHSLDVKTDTGREDLRPAKGGTMIGSSPNSLSFEVCGTELFDLKDTPLTTEDWHFLKKVALEIPREHVGMGDTGEECELEVGRVMVDVKKPTVVNHAQADVLLPIVASEKMANWVAEKTGHKTGLQFRRCAINFMPKDAIVGEHNDGETNPDYLYFVVVHLSQEFQGGEFYSTHYRTGERIEVQNTNQVCLSRCNLRHGVKRVTEGVRASLIWFYADKSAPEFNRRNYDANPLPAESSAAKGFGGLIES
jgi:hypothetical protein